MGWREYTTFTAAEAANLLSPLGVSLKAIGIALKHPLFRAYGRRNRVFTLPAASSARKAVRGDENQAARDELGEEAFKSLKAYRIALHGAFVARRPGEYFRQLLARRLGVSRTTTINYDRELRHLVRPHHKFHQLTDEMIDALPDETPTRRKFFLLVKHKDKPFFAPLKKQIALYWRSMGYVVQLVEQTMNSYQPAATGSPVNESAYADFIQS